MARSRSTIYSPAAIVIEIPTAFLGATATEVPIHVMTRDAAGVFGPISVFDTTSFVLDRDFSADLPTLTLFDEFTHPGDTVAFDASVTDGLLSNREPLLFGATNFQNTADPSDLANMNVAGPFLGAIDEVAFFRNALNESQVEELIKFGPVGVVE